MKTHIELAELFRKPDGWVTVGTDTQYQFIETEDETVLVFAESNTLFDWVTNLNFPKQPYKQMDVEFYVHRGYLREWKRIQDVFVDYFIAKLRTGDAIKPITITGWSYGGAMAVLTMESLWYTFPLFRDSLRLVTFGCPRVIGFKNFKDIRERWPNTVLYRNSSDFVTKVPFLLMGFRHVRKVIKIGDKWKLWSVFKTNKTHLIESYIDSLKKLPEEITE